MTHEEIVNAGGIVDSKAKLKEESRVASVSARGYRHKALGSDVIVCLCSEQLAPGVDLEMEFLGFEKPESTELVGKQKRQALGFPGWALIHDPKHAGYALEVVKEFKKEARRAKSKPGHAKTAIDAIAAKLDGSVPHFLPTFYEEAGRAFYEGGAVNYAAQCFGKARDAERVHALEVDEERRRDAFVEFALMGAITIKSITAYAKDLANDYEPAEAYEHFVTLAVKRTLGGMPPWASMPKDLRRLMKAAKLAPAEEEERVLLEIIEAPSLRKAPAEFWKQYEKPLIKIAQDNESIRGALLALIPDLGSCEAYQRWLLMLEKCGALEALWTNDVPEKAKVPSRAKWFSRWIAQIASGWNSNQIPERTFELLRQMTPLLLEEKQPLNLSAGWRGMSVDLCELCVERGIALLPAKRDRHDHDDGWTLDFAHWAKYAEQPGYGCDPIHIAADVRFGEALKGAIESNIGDEPFDTVARGKAGLQNAKKEWLEAKVEALKDGTLPEVSRVLELLRDKVTIETFSEFPEVYKKLELANFGRALGRTLRAGLIDELGWEPYDKACDELDPDHKTLVFFGAFPYLVITNKTKAIALGPEGRLVEHDLRLPKGGELHALRYCQGQIMVMYRNGRERMAYWTDKPNDTFSIDINWSFDELGGHGVVLPDGGITEGDKAYYAGDRETPKTGSSAVSDGTNFWNYSWGASDYNLREFDPATGKSGRTSMPAFIAAYERDGMRIDQRNSWLLPMPPGATSSVLGSKDGMMGARVRVRDWDSPLAQTVPIYECEFIDGQTWIGGDRRVNADALLTLPGADAPTPMGFSGGYRSMGEISLYESDGIYQIGEAGDGERGYAKGTHTVLGLVWWNLFAFRSEADSLALRKTSDEAAGELLALAQAEIEKSGKAELTTVAAKLEHLENARLAKGVLGLVSVAVQAATRFASYRASVDPELVGTKGAAVSILDEKVKAVLGSVAKCSYGEGNIGQRLGQIANTLRRPMKEEAKLIDHEDSCVSWLELVDSPHVLAYLASCESTPEESRELILLLMNALADVFRSIECEYRVFEGELDDAFEETLSSMQVDSWVDAGVFHLNGNDYVREDSLFLEIAHSGEFKLPKGLTINKAIECHVDADALDGLAEGIRGKKAVPWDPAIGEVLSAKTGLSPVEASLLWLGLPGIETWESNWVPKPVREMLKLRVSQCTAAKEVLKHISHTDRRYLLAAAVPDDVEALWSPLGSGPDDETSPVARVANAWIARMGKKVLIAEEVLIAATKEIESDLGVSVMFGAMATAASSPLLTQVATWSFKVDSDDNSVDFEPSTSENIFNEEVLRALVEYIPWTYHNVPVGDPLRKNLVATMKAVSSTLRNKELILSLGSRYLEEGKKKEDEVVSSFLDALGGKPLKKPSEGRDTGALLAIRGWSTQIEAYFRPAKVGDAAAVEALATSAKLFETWQMSAFEAMRLVLSDGYAAMIAHIEKTEVPEGEYEVNPLHSVPELVTKVGKKFDVDEDAAVLYLQSLALLNPTTKAVRGWNGWTAACYKKAAAQLADRKLLIEAKRSRAGRTFFLPGGWEALKTPHAPTETWKLGMYGITRDKEGLQSVLPRHHMLRPVHEIFAEAWKRVIDGDEPRYEEVK